MKILLPIAALFMLAACATGDLATDCLNAQNAVSAAQAAVLLSEVFGSGDLAQTSLAIAQAQQSAACPVN